MNTFKTVQAIFNAQRVPEEADQNKNYMAQMLKKDGSWGPLQRNQMTLRGAKTLARLEGVLGGVVVRVILITPNGTETVWVPTYKCLPPAKP